MKNLFTAICVLAGAAAILCGCNKTETESPQPLGGNSKTVAPASAPTPAPALAPATEAAPTPTPVAAVETAPVTAPAIASVVETAKSVASELGTKLVAQAKSATDEQLGTIASELTGKVNALETAVGANDVIKAKLVNTLQSLANGLDVPAITSAFQLAEAAKLTSDQLTVAKEVGNLASAYVVQKNFAALDGAQGDVATIVNSLRKGEVLAAIPALEKISQNTHLSDPQKELIASVVDKYAPGLKKAMGSVQQGIQTLKSLPGFK